MSGKAAYKFELVFYEPVESDVRKNELHKIGQGNLGHKIIQITSTTSTRKKCPMMSGL